MSDALNSILEAETSEHSEFYDILQKLMDASDNLDLKTRINKPTRFATLKIIADFIQDQNLEQSSKILMNFIETLFRYNISLNGKSREEICRAISSLVPPKEESNENINGVNKERL